MLWTSAIDDSADRDRKKVIISAALVGDREQWASLSRVWTKRLQEDGLEYFKSSQCDNLRGQFMKYRDRPTFPPPAGRQAADKVREDLDRIIRECDLVGVGAVIPVPLWNRLREDPEYAAVCCHDPYDWAVQTVWLQSTDVLEKLGRGHLITHLHDEGSNRERIRALYGDYKRKNPRATRRFAGIRFLDDKQSPPIQAADIAASVVMKLALEWEANPAEAKPRRLEQSIYRVNVWDEAFAKRVLKK